MDAKEFLRLREKLEEKRSYFARLQGKKEMYTHRLSKEFDCTSTAKGEKLLTKMTKEVSDLEGDLKKLSDDFKEKYRMLLEE